MLTSNKSISTSRLILESLRVDHAAALYQDLCSPELYRFTDDAPPPDLEWLKARYARLESRISPDGSAHWLNWAVWSTESACYVGYVQATVSSSDNEAEIAYVLFPDHWGHGYAREAVAAMMDEIQSLGITRFIARTAADNVRSITLLKSLGFADAGRCGAGDVDTLWYREATSTSASKQTLRGSD